MKLEIALLKKMPFASIDLHFAAAVGRMAGKDFSENPELFAAAAIASAAVRNGHTCCDLRVFEQKTFSFFFREISGGASGYDPELEDPLLPSVESFRNVIRPPWGAVLNSGDPEEGNENYPLILDPSGRLYLCRYFYYEKELAERLIAFAGSGENEFEPDPAEFNSIIPSFQLDPDHVPEETDWQKFAAYLTGFSPLTIITGGPGTGKTSVVSAVLALIISKAINSGNSIPKIVLCAPTGKAQSRLAESIADSLEKLQCSETVKSVLKKMIDPAGKEYSCGTIHAILKPLWNTPNFQRNEVDPLDADILLADEVSMVSLPLMCKLLRALKPGTKLILLGDKNQLASVDAGSVMADLCKNAVFDTLSEERKQKFLALAKSPADEIPVCGGNGISPLSGHIAELKKARRYPPESRIARVCTMIKEKKSVRETADEILGGDTPDFQYSGPPGKQNQIPGILKEFFGDLPRQVRSLMAEPSLQNMKKVFFLLRNHKILAAHNAGASGVDNLNDQCRKLFGMSADHATGMPVMILENDKITGLYNGDIGLLWNSGSETKVYFPVSPDDPDPKSFYPYELPAHVPVFAMTIHKSQGDGFDDVLIILPESESPVLSRELIYTAISRAKKKVRISCTREILEYSLAREVIRHSGLADRLQKNSRQ